VVAISLGQYAIAISFAFMPLAFIDITIRVNHSTLALWHTIDPVTIVTITVFEKEGASAVLLVFEPVAGVLSPQLATFIPPIGALSMLLIHGPHAFILVALWIELDAEAFLAVVAPVADVPRAALPHLSLNGAILLLCLLFDPVY